MNLFVLDSRKNTMSDNAVASDSQENIGTWKIGYLYLQIMQIRNNLVGKCLSKCKVNISWHIIMRKWENCHCAYSCISSFFDPWKVLHCWSPEGKVQIYAWPDKTLTQSSLNKWAGVKGSIRLNPKTFCFFLFYL